MDLYRTLVRPLLFSCDAEWIHNRTLDVGAALGATHVGRSLLRTLFEYSHPSLHCTVAGLHFATPLGLAAVFDKHGRAVRALDARVSAPSKSAPCRRIPPLAMPNRVSSA